MTRTQRNNDEPNFLRYLEQVNWLLCELGLPFFEPAERTGPAVVYRMKQTEWHGDQPFTIALMHMLTGDVHLGIDAPDHPPDVHKGRFNCAQAALEQAYRQTRNVTVDLGPPYPTRARAHVQGHIRTLFERLQKYRDDTVPFQKK